ncbi:hypothetical protein UCRPA7_2660 [Phaeoacremonium minimum UCRPA7]|uniref:Uncharacterized protein n=1 Tax=Phaeoacremonium minimum (strain UCR-PA7) TaxID=1286976 RepID=R8BRF3_PHAM7|nr:hypothetical protein UCRPA7_2660 [Phaeoacremonium minimum UCRPA7]EOO01860.1 hypothetical protein UCRPA7_2660 [Phaeoacremonium minimum UCRPA7]
MRVNAEDYERRLPKLITTGVLSRKSSFAIGQPAKLFVCISDSSPLLTTRLPLSSAQQQQGTIGTGPTPTQVHIIASSADHFTGFPLLQDWARDAHEQRKRSFPAQNKDALHLTRAFYEAWHSAMPTESPASRQVLAFWNFVHQWTSQGSAFPSSSTGQPPPTSSYRGAGAGAGAVDLGAAFFDHWDKTATALDARNKLKVCPRCPKCRGIFLFAQSWSSLVSENIDPKQPLQKPSSHTQEFGSGSCAEHLGHLFCLDLCRSRGQGHGYGEAVVTAGGGVVAEEPMQVQGQGQGQGQVQTRNNERLEHSGGWNVVQHHRARGGQRGGAGWGQ